MSKTYWLHCESGKEAERLPAPLTDAAGRQDYQTASASNTPLTVRAWGSHVHRGAGVVEKMIRGFCKLDVLDPTVSL